MVDVDEVATDVTVRNGTFAGGEMHLYDADGLTFDNCTFVGEPTRELNTVCKFLGGRGWRVLNCRFRGGVVKSQLGMGLNSRVLGDRQVPTRWLVSDCVFEPLDGQWGEYPQGHNVYCLTDPKVDMQARIDHCTIVGSRFGAALKLGGTGNDPRFEGVRGVLVTNCVITGVLDDAGRALAVLTQGNRTRVMLRDCTLICDTGTTPWVQAMDDAKIRMENTQLPDGVTSWTTWFRLVWFNPDEKVVTPPGEEPPRRVGGIVWGFG